MVTKPDIYCIILNASKNDGMQVISYSFLLDYIVENRTKAVMIYSEFVRITDELRCINHFTTGKVQLFHPVIMPDGHYTTEIDGDVICESRFGEQEGKE